MQKLRVQQQLDDAKDGDDAGRVPRTLDVECVGDGIVDVAAPGDVVVVAGVVRVINAAVASGRHDKRALAQATSVMSFFAARTRRRRSRGDAAAAT